MKDTPEQLMARVNQTVQEMRQIEKDLNELQLDINVTVADLEVRTLPLVLAQQKREMIRDHAAQLAEMDRILEEEEKKMKAQESQWAEEDRKAGLK
jgi:hypothetical protein